MSTEPNRMGVFAEMQIISYNFIILKHNYSDQFTISKDIDAESPIIIFRGGGTICIYVGIMHNFWQNKHSW